MTPYASAAREQYGQDVIDWLLILQVDRGRMLPPHIEQRMRVEGMIKFKYRQEEAYLTRRGRRCARLLAQHDAGSLKEGSNE